MSQNIQWLPFGFLIFILLCDRILLCIPGCPGTFQIDQAGLRDPSASASRVKGMKVCTTTPSTVWVLTEETKAEIQLSNLTLTNFPNSSRFSSVCRICRSPQAQSLASLSNLQMWHGACNFKWRQEDKEFKAIPNYLLSLSQSGLHQILSQKNKTT